MPLNLDQFNISDEIITFNGEDFIVTASIPYKTMSKFQEMVGNGEGSTIDDAAEWLKKILSVKNDEAKVSAFVDMLTVAQIMKVSTFISEYITASVTELKKKDSIAPSVSASTIEDPLP